MPESSAQKLLTKAREQSFRGMKTIRQRLSPRNCVPLVVFVSGVHRSGTNMLMKLLDASYETTVYRESDARAFDRHMMRASETIRALIERCPSKVIVIKALHEAHRLKGLLGDFAPARALWAIRNFEDVVNSSLYHWPGWRNKIEELLADRGAADWRGLGMTEQTHAIMHAHYRPALSDASAQALFWFYRHQLLFDQRLDSDSRVATVVYEEAVKTPDAVVRQITDFVQIRPTARMARVAQTQPTPQLPADVAPDIRELCNNMQQRLRNAHGRNLGTCARPVSAALS